MSGLLIPDDWNQATDGFCEMTIIVPNSPYWRANVKGQIQRLTFTYRWDAEIGDPDQAAAISQDIFDSLVFNCQLCADAENDFNVGVGTWVTEVGDWQIEHQPAQGYLKLERDNGASSQSFKISQVIDRYYEIGAIFEVELRTRELVTAANVFIRYTNPGGSQADVQILNVVNTGMTIYSVDLTDYPQIESGATIDAVVFEFDTSGPSTNYARALVNYYTYTCP